MTTVSAEARETARKALAFLFQRLSSVGQAGIADALGTSEATLSRIKNNDLETLCLIVALCGGKIVPSNVRCYRPQDIQPLLDLAKQRMDQLQTVDQLRFDE